MTYVIWVESLAIKRKPLTSSSVFRPFAASQYSIAVHHATPTEKKTCCETNRADGEERGYSRLAWARSSVRRSSRLSESGGKNICARANGDRPSA